MKDGLYKYGEDFEADAFWEHMQYIITKYRCCYDECDNKCENCEYGIIISEYESNLNDDVANDAEDYDDYGFEETDNECVGQECEDCPYKDSCTL